MKNINTCNIFAKYFVLIVTNVQQYYTVSSIIFKIKKYLFTFNNCIIFNCFAYLVIYLQINIYLINT